MAVQLTLPPAASTSSLKRTERIACNQPQALRLLASTWRLLVVLALCWSCSPSHQALGSGSLPRITACLMVRGELTYLPEWIEFHYLQGVHSYLGVGAGRASEHGAEGGEGTSVCAWLGGAGQPWMPAQMRSTQLAAACSALAQAQDRSPVPAAAQDMYVPQWPARLFPAHPSTCSRQVSRALPW